MSPSSSTALMRSSLLGLENGRDTCSRMRGFLPLMFKHSLNPPSGAQQDFDLVPSKLTLGDSSKWDSLSETRIGLCPIVNHCVSKQVSQIRAWLRKGLESFRKPGIWNCRSLGHIRVSSWMIRRGRRQEETGGEDSQSFCHRQDRAPKVNSPSYQFVNLSSCWTCWVLPLETRNLTSFPWLINFFGVTGCNKTLIHSNWKCLNTSLANVN